MPSLDKIRNLVKTLRRKFRESNTIDDIRSFLAQYRFSQLKDYESDDFFCYGEQYGDGSDERHFQIAFSSHKLINNIPIGKVFHLDATCRVLKLAYQVIVFGLSDINRKFFQFPLLLLVTRQNSITSNFFESLKEIRQ